MQGKRPNLVYIYAESLERTYFDTELFPGLADELNALRTDSIDFSNTQQLPGTGYTIAGMVASQCGIPLFAPFDGNASSAVSTFYPENVCLGDVLKAAGYSNYFYQGAELAFAGKDTFLKSHGFDHVYGFKELREQVADPSYKNDWGWYDDSVLDVVYGKFVELSKQRQPFAVHPDRRHPSPGRLYLRRLQQKSYAWQNKENRSLSAVACSQQHIAALIDKIKRSPYFSNTVIVVSSDHLAMNNTAYDILTKQKRRNLFFIIDGTRPLAEQRNESAQHAGQRRHGAGRDGRRQLHRPRPQQPVGAVAVYGVPEHRREDQRMETGGDQPVGPAEPHQRLQRGYAPAQLQLLRRHLQVPFILRVGDNRIEPMFNVYLSTAAQAAGRAGGGEKFVWVDKCYEIGRVWAPQLALSTDICVASGTLVSPPQIVQANGDRFRGKVSFTAPAADSVADYQNAVARLQVDDAAMKYRADSIEFMLPGMPEQVKAITGVSGVEEWGRWSDANLAPAVDIDYVDPLPKRFDLVLRARAYGNNVGEPISVRVGDEERFVSLGEQDSTVTLRFDNPRGAQKISITRRRRPSRKSASGGFYAEEAGHRPGVAEGRSGRPAS